MGDVGAPAAGPPIDSGLYRAQVGGERGAWRRLLFCHTDRASKETPSRCFFDANARDFCFGPATAILVGGVLSLS